MNETIIISLSAVVASALLTGSGWLIKSYLEGRRADKIRLANLQAEQGKLALEAIRKERMASYLDAIEPLISIITKAGTKNSDGLGSIVSMEYRRKAFLLVLFGDDQVVRRWNSFWQAAYKQQPDAANVSMHLANLAELLLEVRRSVGQSDTKLVPEEMFAWLIRDIDKLSFPARNTKK